MGKEEVLVAWPQFDCVETEEIFERVWKMCGFVLVKGADENG